MNIRKESKLSILISLAPVLSAFQWEKTISEKYDMSILNSVKDHGFDLNLENLNELRKTARRIKKDLRVHRLDCWYDIIGVQPSMIF